MNEREEANRFECCERCGEPPALCGCWSTNNDLVGRLRSELSALRQQLAEKEQDFQVVKLAVIETEGRCAEFKAMLDDTLKQEFAVRQQLAEARAEVERVKEENAKILEPHQLSPGLMRHACIAAVGYLTGSSIQSKEQMIATLREAVTTPCAGWETFQSLREQLAAQAAELERLREQLSEADLIIGSTNKQAGNHAEARHALTPALRDSIHRYILRWHSTGNET